MNIEETYEYDIDNNMTRTVSGGDVSTYKYQKGRVTEMQEAGALTRTTLTRDQFEEKGTGTAA